MDHSMGLLTGLPTELIRKIATRCLGRTLIAFAATCHRFRTICNDPGVFREAVLTRFREDYGNGQRTCTNQIDALSIRAGSDLGLWARYAVATDRVVHLTELRAKLDASTELRDEILWGVLDFVPQLLALGYARACGSHLALLLTAAALSDSGGTPAFPDTYDVDTLSKLAFSFAADASEGAVTKTLTSTQSDRLEAMFGALRTTLLTDMGFEAATMLYDGQHTYFLVGIILKSLQTSGLGAPQFRSMLLLPNENAMVLPPPFTADRVEGDEQWKSWLRSASAQIVHSSNLQRGEWCDYVSNDPFLLTFSGLLEEIRLQVERTEDSSAIVKGTGKEGPRNFTLEGRVNAANGRVVLIQEYPGWQRTEWHGVATIFGIVGYWTQLGERPRGYFLIWNRI
ncbi:hypothetical protein F5883DRAFT_645729 [Diaporthe sp. PMI_573]|nr:hypothetical protein F5883DRAFT_645729 [Diaporthaceae sp. PMI_573]